MKPVYVVAGFPRSGTTAMMTVAAHGGLKPIIGHNGAVRSRTGYMRQPESAAHFYEPLPMTWTHPDLFKQFGGCVIKFLLWKDGLALPHIPDVRWRVAVMQRPRNQVAESMRAAYGRDTIYNQRKLLRWATGQARRPDVESLNVVDYPTLCTDPELVVESLAWPLTNFAAGGVDCPMVAPQADIHLRHGPGRI